MKKLPKITSLFLSFGLLFTFLPQVANATSGPVGLNSLRTESGPGVGQITLNWTRYYPNVDNYSIAYGTSPGNYQYGVSNIGNSVVYTIGGLNPGQRYYFFIYPSSQGVPLTPVSPEISDIASRTNRTVTGVAGPYGQRALAAVAGPGSGQVTLTWQQILPGTTNFNVVYGFAPGAYLFGAANLPANNGTNTFTVSSLAPGTRYYFAVIPVQSGTALYSSAEVSQVSK